MGQQYKVPLRDVVYLKSQECRTLKRGNTGVPILRVYTMSLLVQYRVPLVCITTPPVVSFGALNNLSPGVLYSGELYATYPDVQVVDVFGI